MEALRLARPCFRLPNSARQPPSGFRRAFPRPVALVGILLGGVDFASLSVTVGSAVVAYGKFIQAIINFLIIGFALFLIVKAMNRMMEAGKKPAPGAPPPPPPEDVQLLREIRDLLRQQRR